MNWVMFVLFNANFQENGFEIIKLLNKKKMYSLEMLVRIDQWDWKGKNCIGYLEELPNE